MKVGFYGHVRQYHNVKDEIDKNISEVLESGSYVMGPMLSKFEEKLASYAGTKYAIGVGNGTDAIWLALMALGIGKGDEVITPANTFFATAEAIWIAGAKVVLVDCDPKTKCIDPNALEAAVTDKTKTAVPVHLYGHTANMKSIKDIADRHDLVLIEDNAQSIDGHGNGFRQAELSDAMTISFIIQKNLGCFGDGGAVVTNNSTVDREVRILRNHGSLKRDVHSFGYNSRLDDLQAGVLSAKLGHIIEWTDMRRKWAKRYSKGLSSCTSIELPYEAPGVRHVYHLYVVETKDASKRDSLLNYLKDAGIDAKTHYSIPIHLQTGYPWGKDAEIRGNLANVEKNAASCVSLPMYPELEAEEVDYVIEKVKEWDKDNS